ncbi:MAG: glycosyl hydrolase [Kiritimatiellales bacterium]
MKKSVWMMIVLCCGLLAVQIRADELEKGFAAPPDSARPWVYLFPLDGNITSNGITADLEAMKRVGIGGVLYMETMQGTPKGPAAFGGPLWRGLFKHLCSESARLGLEVNMNNDAGWCGSGGPWITPELSMQRAVWSETNVTGPKRSDAVLQQPKAVKDFYRDIAVFAYPAPAPGCAVAHLRGKSGAVREEIPLRTTFPALPPGTVVARDRLVELTGKLGKDGRLVWDVPAGKWTILRIGHTTTGKDNHPAPGDGRGLESDKFSKEATKAHFDGLMQKLIDDNKPLAGRTLVATHIDSWETGTQNWTPKFREEFQRLRGYDPLPLLPVMAGRIVDSPEISERFLWDMRMTANDLLKENYAGYFRELAHQRGLRLSIEAYGNGPYDDLTFAGQADEPMSEFWAWNKAGKAQKNFIGASSTCTEMASAAHVYGRPVLGAEAFTAADSEKWQSHPAGIKAIGDWAFCEGINRFVFHRYALQPWTNPDRAPGVSMGPWGLHYERTQTWWEQSKAWHEYLARCQFLLQQGLFVADLCFLSPETSPQAFKSPVKSGLDRPGYNFDGCPPEVVLTRMTVKDGRLVLPDGMNYRMLVLPQVRTMTPQLLRKIRDLVKDGATVLGMPPVQSPGLSGYPECDAEVKALAHELWGDGEAPVELTTRPFGKGRVTWGRELQPKPDADYETGKALSGAKWIWFNEGHPGVSALPGACYFRRTVKVDGDVESARLVMTADNNFEVWVNGKRIGSGDKWESGCVMSIGAQLKPGENIIAVEADNTTGDPSPAGLIAAVKIKYRDGRTQELCTDAAWEAAKTVSGNWKTGTASAPEWIAARELGALGIAPWGEVEEMPAGAQDVITDISIPSRVLAQSGLPPDFKAEPNLRYIHKKLGDTDIYFVANPETNAVESLCAFRITGKQPELWWPDTGRMETAAVYEEKAGVTQVPLRFDPSGSMFVVFRKKSEIGNRKSEIKNWLEFKPVQEIAGPWEVSFDPERGPFDSAQGRRPGEFIFEKLEDWSKRPEPGIRYYSGTATYRKTFQSAIDNPQSEIFLDLGNVAVMAEVKLNGKDLGILWKPPFRIDITDAVKKGGNELEVKVVNLWINRMIGDEQLPEDSDRNPNGTLKSWPSWLNEGKPSPTGRFTFTSWRLWKKDDALAESGLLGPVTLQTAGIR